MLACTDCSPIGATRLISLTSTGLQVVAGRRLCRFATAAVGGLKFWSLEEDARGVSLACVDGRCAIPVLSCSTCPVCLIPLLSDLPRLGGRQPDADEGGSRRSGSSRGSRQPHGPGALTTAVGVSCLAGLPDGSVVAGTAAGDLHHFTAAGGVVCVVRAVQDGVAVTALAAERSWDAAGGGAGAGAATAAAMAVPFAAAFADGTVRLWEPPEVEPGSPRSRASGSRAGSSSGSRAGSSAGHLTPAVKLEEYEDMAEMQMRGALPVGAVDEETGLMAEGHAKSLALSTAGPDGGLAVACGCSTNSVLLLSAETFEPLLTQSGLPGRPAAVDTHPAAPYFATAGAGAAPGSGLLAVWALGPHRLLASTELSTPASAVAIGPTGDDMVVGLADGSVLLVDMRPQDDGDGDGQPGLVERARRADLQAGVASVAISSDGSFAAAVGGDGELWLYSLRSGLEKAVRLAGPGKSGQGGGGGGGVRKRPGSRGAAGAAERRWQLDFSADSRWLHSSCAGGECGPHSSEFWSVAAGSQADQVSGNRHERSCLLPPCDRAFRTSTLTLLIAFAPSRRICGMKPGRAGGAPPSNPMPTEPPHSPFMQGWLLRLSSKKE